VEGRRSAIPPRPVPDDEARTAWAHHVKGCDVGAAGVAARYQFLDGAAPVGRGGGEYGLGLARVTTREQEDALHDVVDVVESLAKIAAASADEGEDRSPPLGWSYGCSR